MNRPRLLGDPHLGRRFNKGIPVERRGERELLVLQQFKAELTAAAADRVETHICLGDLFDKPQVDYATLIHAACIYRDAASNSPGTTFYIIQGNHDDSRDLAEVTAWDVFQGLIVTSPNIVCVTEPMIVPDLGAALFPWKPDETAVEMVGRVAMGGLYGVKLTTAYGHWDVDPRSASHNLIPTKELAALGITKAYTGHVHLPSILKRDGIEVEVIGSMQPYAQGEDGGQGPVRYVTLSADDQLLYSAGAMLKDCCVRVILKPGESWEGPIPECRSWDIQRARPVDAEAPADVSMEGFDTMAVTLRALDDHEITPTVRQQIDGKIAETFGREHV
ncbi:hypothetical protein [Methylobacterium aquaticum]|uniref:DNA repair exonuclease n=1 Tax=Methylobacterium aquaticum TaxID=270351 RepID=A0A0C6FPR5_9HYPH|nr:hypothetical protein [Methylobacterium aquaticum]BAQ50263.1 DNA repair exonuclease [Methylobacterium aquaticum]